MKKDLKISYLPIRLLLGTFFVGGRYEFQKCHVDLSPTLLFSVFTFCVLPVVSLLFASLVAVMEGNQEDGDVEQHQPMPSFKLFSDDDELERPLEVGASSGRKKGHSGTRFCGSGRRSRG